MGHLEIYVVTAVTWDHTDTRKYHNNDAYITGLGFTKQHQQNFFFACM